MNDAMNEDEAIFLGLIPAGTVITMELVEQLLEKYREAKSTCIHCGMLHCECDEYA